MPAKVFLLLFLFLLFSTPKVFAQDVSSVPIEVGNIQVQKATGAAFKEGWNFFTLDFGGCIPRIVLNELQADGGSALKVETLFIKELLGWQPYSILNIDSVKKKIGGGDTLAFYSNQKFYFDMNQKVCSNPDKERQAQIDRIGGGNTAKGSFTDKIRELPIDMWTKLMDLLNQKNNSAPLQQNTGNQNRQSFDNLTVSGKLTVNDLGITGTMSQGLLAINGLSSDSNSATINTLSGDLYFQNNVLGGANFLNGKVLIDKDGNLKVQNEIFVKKLNIYQSESASPSIGQGVLKSNSTSVVISTTAVSDKSRIFITPSSKTGKQSLLVTQRGNGEFTVSIEDPYSSDITFDWWIVN